MRSARGFTLIEILVVIVIIGILASLALVGVNAAIQSSKRSATESRLQMLEGACQQYRLRWGDYPPSTLSDFGIALSNETNNGAEALCACLASTLKGGSLLSSVKDDEYVNVDADAASKNVTTWFFGDNQLREISDAYAQPITYIHWKDYQRGPAAVRKYVFAQGMPEQMIAIEVSGATKTFLRADSFQIGSAGRDGKVGTEDDVKLQ